jgi:hypothetical protein
MDLTASGPLDRGWEGKVPEDLRRECAGDALPLGASLSTRLLDHLSDFALLYPVYETSQALPGD